MRAAWSGAAIPRQGSRDYVIEGVAGRGDQFMLGQRAPGRLPPVVVGRVNDALSLARDAIGNVRAEWVDDGTKTWIVQLHRTRHALLGETISPGEPLKGWLEFDPAAGLEELKATIDSAVSQSKGVRVTGRVGITSHVGDLLRRAGIPARLNPRT